MTEQTEDRRLPPPAALIAGGLVVTGVLLSMFVSTGLLVVAGLGAFGPGILRELGWLEDQDEFQRQAAHRAGYHAYLIGGLAAVLIASLLSWSQADLGSAAEWTQLILVVLWTSWLFSALLAYWGARKTAARVLMAFGSFWAVFVLANLVGQPPTLTEPSSFLGILAGLMFVAPFFLLAYTARRRPRSTGALLILISIVFLVITNPVAFSATRPVVSPLKLSTTLMTAALLLVPLVASGIALLKERPEEG